MEQQIAFFENGTIIKLIILNNTIDYSLIIILSIQLIVFDHDWRNLFALREFFLNVFKNIIVTKMY